MTVHFIGAGPGAPDLITVRGARLIAEADVIIYAGSLVNPALLDGASPTCRLHDSAKMTLDEIMAVIEDAESRGETTVRLHSGDPSLYGAIHEQARILDQRGITYDVCPGVSAFSGAAAALKMEYTVPEVTQSVVITRMPGRTPMPEKETVAHFAAAGSSMVIFLSTGLLTELTEQLIAGGRTGDEPAAIVYKATWPGEESIFHCTIDSLAKTASDNHIRSTALIIVGPCLTPTDQVSRLYAADFSTQFRRSTHGRGE